LKKLIWFALLLQNKVLLSQTVLQGAYYFRKQELVAGFNFGQDKKFEFFYSYGAADRNARGTYSVSGDTVTLVSEKKGGADFTVTTQVKTGTGFQLQFVHPNKYLLQNIECVFVTNGKEKRVVTDASGMAKVDFPACDTIYVHHLLYPDVFTLVKDRANVNNRFILSLNPSLEQVSFKFLSLRIVNDGLALPPNYFMPLEDIVFVKE
jgi:hypothetical protein